MPWDGPHVFADGAGNTASGEEVMENLQFLQDLLDNLPVAGGSGPATVTVLPAGADGDDQVLLVDAVNGVQWQVRYRAASASPYKWEAKGATPLTSDVPTIESGAGAAVQDLATAGPTVVVPNAGDYDVWYGALGAPTTVFIQLYVAGVLAAGDEFPLPGSDAPTSVYRRKLALAAGTQLKLRYRGPAGAWAVGHRWLSVRPVRIA